ncbi:MAG TPA: dihydrofolate reductase family protein [Solirubrobacterales bacterium]|nr:dihydrofolate reductase family protein [Solirubrobacterales bacterium]
MRRLLPNPGPTTVAEQYSHLRLVERARPDRPYLVTNFALTVDGRAQIDGRSGPIGDRADSEVLHRLRTQVDAVMIGAGTLRMERYGRMVPDPALRGLRERGERLAPDPLAVVVTGSLDLPWDAPLFTCGHGRVLIVTSSEAEIPTTATSVRVERHPGAIDLRRALATLAAERGVRAVLCEGGPHLHANLVREALVDEMFVTVAPKLALNDSLGLLAGGFGAVGPVELELAWLLETDGELFARYRVPR